MAEPQAAASTTFWRARLIIAKDMSKTTLRQAFFKIDFVLSSIVTKDVAILPSFIS